MTIVSPAAQPIGVGIATAALINGNIAWSVVWGAHRHTDVLHPSKSPRRDINRLLAAMEPHMPSQAGTYTVQGLYETIIYGLLNNGGSKAPQESLAAARTAQRQAKAMLPTIRMRGTKQKRVYLREPVDGRTLFVQAAPGTGHKSIWIYLTGAGWYRSSSFEGRLPAAKWAALTNAVGAFPEKENLSLILHDEKTWSITKSILAEDNHHAARPFWLTHNDFAIGRHQLRTHNVTLLPLGQSCEPLRQAATRLLLR